MNKQDTLFEIADRQQGYFTSQQAEESGFPASNFHRYLSSGQWIKEERGIYRLAHYPVMDRSELVLWSLWSRNRKGLVQGVWSHETALDIYELSDVMPAKMHMTVPQQFRKAIEIPKVLVLHFTHLAEADIEQRQGYRVTTPIRTLLDIAREGKLSDDLIAQAVNEAMQRGLIIHQDLLSAGCDIAISKLKKLLNEYKV